MQEDLRKLHHERSQKDFPMLELEKDEYVVLDIHRAMIGLIGIWAAAFVAVFILTLAWALLNTKDTGVAAYLGLDNSSLAFLYLIIFVLLGVVVIASLIASKVYSGNRLFVTNRRLIHYQVTSLFSKSVNIIALTSIEDASYHQKSIFHHIFRFGTIRLSTVGDETTYTFDYVSTPTDELKTISHLMAVEKERAKRGGHHHTHRDETAEEFTEA